MMISIQSPGYTGMDRFGEESTYGSPPSDRSHRRIHSDLLQSRDMLIDSDSSLASTVTKKIKCNGKSSHDLHYSYSSQQRHCGLKRCPHHVALPDNNDWDSVDSRLQLNNSYQRAEITRTYIKPPPNKTALDVPPEYEYKFSSSTSPNLHHNRTQATPTAKQSKQNPIAKFLLRISSSKSNEHNSGNSYSSSSSSNNSLISSLSNVGDSKNNSNSITATALTNNIGQQQRGNYITSTASVKSLVSHNLPTYTESQLMHQQQQQLLLNQATSSWSSPSNNDQFSTVTEFFQLGDCPSTSTCDPIQRNVLKHVGGGGSGGGSSNSLNRSPSPNIYKSRSMCGNMQSCSFSSISTLPTSMINNIVNNSANIGSSSAAALTMATCDASSTNNGVSPDSKRCNTRLDMVLHQNFIDHDVRAADGATMDDGAVGGVCDATESTIENANKTNEQSSSVP